MHGLLLSLFLIFSHLSCHEPELDCIVRDDIVEVWFELKSNTISFDHCYLLTEDNLVIEKDKDEVWKAGEWFVIDRCDSCIFKVGTHDITLELIKKQDECILVKYNDWYDATICNCSY